MGDQFGNYVVQHLICKGGGKPNLYIPQIIGALSGRVSELCLHKFSSNVLEKCLAHALEPDRNTIVNELLNPGNSLPSVAVKSLLWHQFGNYVVQRALKVCRDPQLSLLLQHCKQPVHDVLSGSTPESSEQGCLPLDQATRLALKLGKR